MSLQSRLGTFVSAVGADVKALYSRSVPAGGTTGQVLTKSSGADYAAGWGTPSSGLFVACQVGQLVTDSTSTSWQAGSALVSGRANFHRLYLAPGTYDAAFVSVTTAQSGGSVTMNVGLYPDDGSGAWPNTSNNPIVSCSGFDLTTVNWRGSTFASPLVVTQPTMYWACSLYLAPTAPTTAPVLGAIAGVAQGYSRPISSSVPITTQIRGYYWTGFSALPNTARTTSTLSINGALETTGIALRRSA